MLYFTSLVLLLVATCNGQRYNTVRVTMPASNQPQPLSDVGTPAVVMPIETTTGLTVNRDTVCIYRNGYYKIDGSCDSYVECIDYRAVNRICPDGLNYSPNVRWPEYPCRYPTEAPCLGRGTIQAAQPTSECSHQYGLFPSDDATPGQCGRYKMCVAGNAIYMKCPTGLAFNPAIGQCDWPEFVPSCNVNEFIGFQCPPAPLDQYGQPLNIVQNYKHEDTCYHFYSCQFGRVRLLSCDHGLGFDPTVGRCVNADIVQCYREEDLI